MTYFNLLISRYGSTAIAAVELAVGFVEITMQLAAFVVRQLPTRPFPRGLRGRLRIACLTKRRPPVSAFARTRTTAAILHAEHRAIERPGKRLRARLYRQHTTK